MSNKRRRNEVEPEFNSNEFLDLLDEYPFVYRSLQTIQWMKKYPFRVEPGKSNVEYHGEVFNYFVTVLNTFFSDCGFQTDPTEQTISDTEINLFIKTPVPETKFEFNFCLFCAYITEMITHEFYTKNIHWRTIKCSGENEYINFKVKLTVEGDEYDEFSHYGEALKL